MKNEQQNRPVCKLPDGFGDGCVMDMQQETCRQRVCRIVGAGEGFSSFAPLSAHAQSDLLIAADGGLCACRAAGVEPDIILGDFDSLGHVPSGDNVLRWPEMKDDTDMMLAIRLGLEKGYRIFYLYGGCGGRFDHTLANLQALAFLAGQGAVGYLFEGGQTLTCVCSGRVEFPALEKGILSVFSMCGKACGVTLRGLLYPLEDGELLPDVPLGVSNHFTGAQASVQVKNGTLILAWDVPVLPAVAQKVY